MGSPTPWTAFATVADLEERLGVTFTGDDETIVKAMLNDAAAYLRSIIGADIYPQKTSTIRLYQYPGDTWLQIPGFPVVEVLSATVDGRPVDVELIDGAIRVCGPAMVELEVTHGYSTPPDELVAWNCVLASQVYKTVKELGSLGAGEVTSLAIDDYRKGFSSSDKAAFDLPDRVVDQLRSRYGGGVAVIGTR